MVIGSQKSQGSADMPVRMDWMSNCMKQTVWLYDEHLLQSSESLETAWPCDSIWAKASMPMHFAQAFQACLPGARYLWRPFQG